MRRRQIVRQLLRSCYDERMNVLVALFALAAPVLGLSQVEVEAALRGEIPARTETFTNAHGQPSGRGLGAILIQRPIAEVWATLIRYEDKPEYIPRLRSVAILEKHSDRVRIRQEIDASITTARYTAWYQFFSDEHAIRWKLDGSAADNTLADVEGEYRLVEHSPTQTLLIYRTYVDPGRAVPQFIRNYMAVKSLPKFLRAVKMRVESGGTWKKD